MKLSSISNRISGSWNRIPLIIRAVLSGFLVSSVGILAWGIALKGFAAPYCILPMIIALWVYWRFYSGSWGSKKSAGIRKNLFRLTHLPPPVWKWGLAGAILFVVIVQSSFVVSFRIIQFPADRFTADYKSLDSLPLGVAWAILIMSSIVAGICEETGFRGYMQVPLEKRYGPATGIILTSVVFMLIHLTHSWATPILPHIFFASVLLGILAYRSGSLIPGIIGHSILDIFDYSVWWTDLTGGFRKQTVFRTGIDLNFIFWVFVFFAAIMGFLLSMEKLKRVKGALPVSSRAADKQYAW